MVAPGDDLAATEKQAVGERLRAARGALSLTQKGLCDVAGMRLPSLRDYELGNRIPGGEAVACLSRAGINANWLLTGEGPMLLADFKVRAEAPAGTLDGYTAIPFFEDVRAAAGGGGIVGNEMSTSLLFNEEWVRTELDAKLPDLRLIRVSGESMEPLLRAGDMILVDCSVHRPNCEGIYVLRLDGMLLVKRVQALPGGVIQVSSDNPAYKPFTLKIAEMEGTDFAIIGRVVWFGRKT